MPVKPHNPDYAKTKIKPCIYLGLDPGASGGIARLDEHRLVVQSLENMTTADIWEYVRGFSPQSTALGKDGYRPVFAILERVGGYAGEAQPGSRMFNFGVTYGQLLMALVAAGIPFEQITPGVWQKGVGIPPRKKGESKTDFKNRLKARAQELFPGVKVTLNVADAILIAEYNRRKREGEI